MKRLIVFLVLWIFIFFPGFSPLYIQQLEFQEYIIVAVTKAAEVTDRFQVFGEVKVIE